MISIYTHPLNRALIFFFELRGAHDRMRVQSSGISMEKVFYCEYVEIEGEIVIYDAERKHKPS